MRLWDIILTANSNLRRNKVRTLLTIIAVFIGAFTITLTAGVNAGVNDYINKQLGSIGGDNVLTVQAKSESTPSLDAGPKEYNPNAATSDTSLGFSLTMLTDEDVAKIQAIDGVGEVVPQVPVAAAYIQNNQDGKKFNVTVTQMVDGFNFDMKVGVVPDNAASAYQIALTDGYAAALGFENDADAVGKTVLLAAKTPLGQIKTLNAEVVGVQNPSLIASGGSLVNTGLNSALFDITTEGYPDSARNQYLAVVVMFESGLSDQQKLATKDAINAAGFVATSVEDQIGTVSTIINAITIALIGFGAIALVAAVFGVVNTLFMAVQERTREIGLMKAMGMSGRKVFLLFSLEAILIGFWGSVLGIILAYGVGQAINLVAGQTFLQDLDGFVLMQFPLLYIAAIIIVIMFITYLAGTLPARRAARQNPIDALRYE